jgi:hypothetical protein
MEDLGGAGQGGTGGWMRMMEPGWEIEFSGFVFFILI